MSKETHDELLSLAAERYKYAIDEDLEDRERYDEDIRFGLDIDGYQWDKQVRDVREKDTPARPCITVNKLTEKIDMVEGEFRQLQPETKVRAVDSNADPKIADILAGIIKHIKYDSNARSAYNSSHVSVLYGGRGAWRFDIVDDEYDPFIRNIRVNRIPNVLSVAFEPDTKNLDKSDANYVFVTEMLAEKEFKTQYPEVNLNSWPADSSWDGWKTKDGYRVAEYWWKDKIQKTYLRVDRLIDGLPTTITIEEKDIKKDDKKIEEKKADSVQVKWCKMIAGQILDGPYDWPTKELPIFMQVGKEVNIGGKPYTRGMVRFSKSPQQLYNYWVTCSTETVALAPKSPYMLTSEMLGPHKEQWDQAHLKNYYYILYESDPNQPGATPRREPPPQLSTAIAGEIARHEHDIMSTMGIYREHVGEEKGDKSGKAILALQKQGNIGTYAYTDNFQIILTYSDRALINLIPHVYDTERIIRIIGEDGKEVAVPINARPGAPHITATLEGLEDKYKATPRENISEYLNDLRVGTYDVVVTVGPSYTTQRQEASAMLMELVKIMPPAMAVNIIDIVVEVLDLPHAQKLMGRIKKMIPPDIRGLDEGEEPPQQQQDPRLMIEIQKLLIEDKDLRRKEWETQAKVMKTMAEADAINRDQTLQELSLLVQEIKERMMGGQQPAQGPQGTPTAQEPPQGAMQ